jgi:hypothetical protein
MMEPEEIQAALNRIKSETDLNVKALLLAALTSTLFREAGFEPVVVGGSAIEFYTDGAYMSGDIDMCWTGTHIPTPLEQAKIVSRLTDEPRAVRQWKVAGLFLDLLTQAETYAKSDYSRMTTPLGDVVLQPVEDLLVERIFVARCWTGPNPRAEDCARKLLASALSGNVDVDWPEVERVASLPAYDCLQEVHNMREDVSAALAESGK